MSENVTSSKILACKHRLCNNLKIVAFAVICGPPLGFLVIGAALLTEIHTLSDFAMMMAVVYAFGVVPSALGGILFACLRRFCGSGYGFAGLCGYVATAIFFTILAGFRSSEFAVIIYLASAAGVLPAVGARYVASKLTDF